MTQRTAQRMMQRTDGRPRRHWAILFSAVYMVSYMTRINYSVVIAEMELATHISKSMLSIALTGSFITYGAGQIVSGICGDRFSPKKLILYGLCASSLMNLLIPLCRNPYQMSAVWCINGLAQAFMWPPIVKLLSALLSKEDYQKAIVTVSWGSSFGTILLYLIAPLLISVTGWKSVFVFSAICGILMTILWGCFACDIEPETPKIESQNAGVKRVFFAPFMICTMLAIVLQGMLRDGVTTWMPTYILETYHISSRISILSGVVLPVFSIVSFQLASLLYKKIFPNPLLCAGVIFGTGTVAALAMALFFERSAVFSVACSALLTGCMHGVNLMLIGMIPSFFQRYGNVSAISGVLNSCTYIGSAISTYGIALLAEHFSWRFTLLTWMAVGAAGTALCLIAVGLGKGKRFF